MTDAQHVEERSQPDALPEEPASGNRPPPISEMPVIYIDQPITRRKAFHVLCSPDGEVLYKARMLSDVLEHLAILEHEWYVLLPVPSETVNDTHVICQHKEL